MPAPATLTVFDNVYDDKGAAIANTTVTCVLDSTVETTSGGLIAATQQSTTTDSNGRFQFTVIGNDLLSPANSTYTISIPAISRSYQIAPQSGNGSSQQTTAANVIVNTPNAIAPWTNLTGNLTVAGTLGVTGLTSDNGGLVVAGGAGATLNASGDLAVRSVTVSSGSGPYSPNLPGNNAVATPAGVSAGKFWDWGGIVYHAMGTGAKGDGVTDDTTNIQNGINTATTAGFPFYFAGPAAGVAFSVGTLSVPSGAKLLSFGLTRLKLKNSVNSFLLQFADVAHTDTQISGLYLDGNGANQNTTFAALIGSVIGPTTLSHNRTIVQNNTLVNAAVHGIFLTEATAGQSNNPKFVYHNIVNGHGLQTTGFGVYADYCGNTIIEGNFCTNTGSFDCIELGHAGPGWLTSLGSLTCVYNIVKGGQINFPFSDNARIEGNFVLNSKISNDTNTANNVTIVGNTVWAPTTTIPAGASGINQTGANGLIEGNYVSVGQNSGIGDDSHAESGCRIIGNIVNSTNAGNSGTGIHVGGNTNGTSNDCIAADNLVTGAFTVGMDLVGNNTMIHDNRVNLSGTASSFKLWGSATMGFVAGVNANIHDNNFFNPIVLPTPGTDAAVPGLQVRFNQGVAIGLTNGFAAGLPTERTGQVAVAVGATSCTVTSPNDGNKHVYRISGAVTITTLGSGNINLEVTYTDDGGTARTCIIPLCAEAGTFATSATTADAYKGSVFITVNPNTTIAVITAGTFTGCTYNFGGLIEQIA